MTYVKKEWVGSPDPLTPVPGSTSLNADSLNHLETQYDEAVNEMDERMDGISIQRVTQEEYDAIPIPRPDDVLYIITPLTEEPESDGASYDLTGKTLAEVNAWLADETLPRVRHLSGSLTVPMDESLVVPSEVDLYPANAEIYATPGTTVPFVIGQGDIAYLTVTGDSLAGSVVLMNSGLTDADVGSWIELAEAGGTVAPPQPFDIPSGTLAWHARIKSVSGSNVITDNPAPLTVAGKVLKVYRPLKNTRIVGGKWHRPEGGTYTLSNVIRLARNENCYFADMTIYSRNAKYALYLPGSYNTVVERIHCDVSSDGVHINGPAANVTISNITGTFGDDVVPLACATEYSGSELGSAPWGNLENITVRNIDAVTTAHMSRLASWAGCKPTGIEYKNIRGTIITNPHPAIVMMGWPEGDEPYFDPIGSVRVSDVKVQVLDNLYAPMVYTRTAVENLSVSGLAQVHDENWYPVVVEGKTNLSIRDMTSDTLVYLAASDTVHTSDGSAVLVENVHSTVRTDPPIRLANQISADILLNSVEFEWEDPMIPAITLGSSAGGIAKITMQGVRIADAGYFIHVDGWTELHLYGDAEPYRPSWQPLVDVQGNATVFLHGDTGYINSMAGFPIIKGDNAKVYSFSLQAKVDVSILETGGPHAPLQLAYNTNAGVAGGAGPARFNGATWVLL